MKIITVMVLGIWLTVPPIQVLAASDKCVVLESEGNTIVLECKKETTDFGKGTKIKIKTDRTGAAVEGC